MIALYEILYILVIVLALHLKGKILLESCICILKKLINDY